MFSTTRPYWVDKKGVAMKIAFMATLFVLFTMLFISVLLPQSLPQHLWREQG